MSYLRDCGLNTEAVLISRTLAAGGSLLVSLVVLAVILLLLRRKAWETLPNRIFIACIVSTGATALASLAGIDYSQKSLQSYEKASTSSCRELALVLHYTGGLVASSYAALVLSHLVRVTLPLLRSSPIIPTRCSVCFGPFAPLLERRGTRIAAEMVLYLLVVLSSIVTCWEPFALAELPQYGSNGLWCDYQLHILVNCSEGVNNSARLYLSVIPYTVMAFFVWILELLMLSVLCGLWVKFSKSLIGRRIIVSLPSFVILLVGTSVVLLWQCIFLAILAAGEHKQTPKSELAWILHATVPNFSNAVALLLVAMFVHFPFRRCCKKSRPTVANVNVADTEHRATNPESVWNHRDVPSTTEYCPPDEMSDYKSDENQALIQGNYQGANYGVN